VVVDVVVGAVGTTATEVVVDAEVDGGVVDVGAVGAAVDAGGHPVAA
jgi:hypothetical protein